MDGAQREEQAAVCVAEEEKGGCLQGMVSTVVSVLQSGTGGPFLLLRIRQEDVVRSKRQNSGR